MVPLAPVGSPQHLSSGTPPGPVLVCGAGYLGERVAQRWRAAGCPVWIVTRSATRAAAWKDQGFHPLIWDVTQPFAGRAELPAFRTVFWAVGFDRRGEASLHEVYVGGMRNLLAALPASCPMERFLYISSTGVYGQDCGEWVVEDSPCDPLRPGGRACLEAEKLLADSPFGSRRVILRLAGIYGPGRIPQLAAVQSGQPIEASPDSYVNLVHVDDAVAVVLAAAQRAVPPELFLVADREPVRRGDFYGELARLVGAPAPRFVPPSPGSGRAERTGSDKRIDASRVRATLRSDWLYPSFREGLAACLEKAPTEDRR